MKTLLSLSLISYLFLGYPGHLNGQIPTNQQKSKIEIQVDSVFQTMVKAAETMDYDKLNLGVDDRHKASFIVNNSYYNEYDTMIGILKANVDSGTTQNISIQNQKITVLSNTIVLITASGVAQVELATGQSFNINFLWSFVYEKINNEWKVIQSHQSQAN